MMSDSFERMQVTEWLGAHTVSKALSYVSAVRDLEWIDGEFLTALVQGSRAHPYRVRIELLAGRKGSWVEGSCTCPVGYNCKHVAAVLMAGLAPEPDLDLEMDLEPCSGNVVRSELVTWLEGFRARRGKSKKKTASTTHALAYVLAPMFRDCVVQIYKSRIDSDGHIKAFEKPWHNVETALGEPPKFVAEEDLPILRGLCLGASQFDYSIGFFVRGATGAAILEMLIATGRAFVGVTADLEQRDIPVKAIRGAARRAELCWEVGSDKNLRPALHIDPPAELLFTSTLPCWYADPESGEAGVLDMPWAGEQIADLLTMPPVAPHEVDLVGSVLSDVAPDVPAPPSFNSAAVREIDVAPVPVLTLDMLPNWADTKIDFAALNFDYAGHAFAPAAPDTIIRTSTGDVIKVKRDFEAERKYLAELTKSGFVSISRQEASNRARSFPDGVLRPDHRHNWPDFLKRVVPRLKAGGWQVVQESAFRYSIVEVDEIDGSLRQAGDGWFDVEMGIQVNGKTMRLEPLLAELFTREARWLAGKMDAVPDDEPVWLTIDRKAWFSLRADRIKPVVGALIGLFDARNAHIRIPPLDLARIHALDQTGRWEFHGDASIRTLAQRLMTGAGMAEVAMPVGLHAELRPYQKQGVAWMQYLREHELSGVLADDMGLGKTIQTLTHLLKEKEAGRLDRPALIVVPTTLVANWCDEARRFAPGLRVLALHGSQRQERFDEIAGHDLVLTTYALLWRDEAAFSQHDYHLLILDEAQYVKNASTKAAQTIRKLNTRHRLCLTGTPLENHLGELWTLFDFLLPGFLGTRQDFTQRWRAPIEKMGDTSRSDLLARRIRPFMLRRTKDEVATELPPKTTIVRTVELDGIQRDLYETVRTAMQKKVRDVVAEKGLARSHIIVLEALLKLRQACCDPRLPKPGCISDHRKSAKLALLMEMLPEMIDEGRRVLLFSQFTSMLAIIGEALTSVGIPYVRLTGDTKDRATPVQQFSDGEVPVFLISLKAGGVGLNLTAADVVIHYDPWWNPAAERQATDRAHRIGQDKPVFVYKLIASGSIEEKIIAMQENKAALAEAILSEDSPGAVKFSAEDVEALLEPIPVVPAARSSGGRRKS